MRSKTVDRLLQSTPEDVKIFVDLYADLVVRINQILREKGITKKQLAEKLEKKPSEISKWLSGDHNFTLRSLAKLQAELGEVLLEVPQKQRQPEFLEGYIRSVHTFVSYKKIETKNQSKIWQLPAKFEESNELNHAG